MIRLFGMETTFVDDMKSTPEFTAKVQKGEKFDVMGRLMLKFGLDVLETIERKEMRDKHCEETNNVL